MQLQCFLLSVLVWQAWGQAPNDQAPNDYHPTCRTGMNINNHIFPQSWVVLLDTFDYRQLFSGTTAVWLERSFDSNNDEALGRWTTVGGSCTQQMNSVSAGAPPDDNWLFSQYINFFDAKEILVNISYRFDDGESIALYGRGSNGNLETTPRTDRNGYRPLIGGDTEASRVEQTGLDIQMKTLFFRRPEPRTSGFYLGIQEQGIFGVVSRIIIYYKVERARTDGLLSCPELPLPAVVAEPAMAVCVCAANSQPLEGVSLVVSCKNDGSCSRGQWCASLPGYQLAGNRVDATSTTACAEGTYKALHDNSSCLICPINSESRGTNNSVCPCIPPNIRDDAYTDMPCSRPPSSPRLILGSTGSPQLNGNIITVCWLPALDGGGLSDLYYNIYVFDMSINDPVYRRDNPMGVVPGGTGKICYDVEVRNGQTNYGIIVVSSNEATAGRDVEELKNVQDVQGRSVTFFVVAVGTSSCNLSGAIIGALFFIALTAVVTTLVTVVIMRLFCTSKLTSPASPKMQYSKRENATESEINSESPESDYIYMKAIQPAVRPGPSAHRPHPPIPLNNPRQV